MNHPLAQMAREKSPADIPVPDLKPTQWVMVRMIYLLFDSCTPENMQEVVRCIKYTEHLIGKQALFRALIHVAKEGIEEK